jgi:hypothetical protein
VLRGEKVVSYTFKAARGPSSTPRAGYYFVNLLRCPKQNLPAIAAAMDGFVRGAYHCGTFKMIFDHLIVSEEDPEIVLSLQGFSSEEDAKFYFNVSSTLHLNDI